MLRALLEVFELPDAPLSKLSSTMKWHIEFSDNEVTELRKFVSMMCPMERLFSKLNCEKESTLHLCYPTVKVTLNYYHQCPTYYL